MIEVRHSLAWALGARVGGHQVVVTRVDLDLSSTTTHPQLLPFQTERCGIVRQVKDDVAIPVQCDLFPLCHIVGCTRQWKQRLALCLEAHQRLLFCRTVDTVTGGGVHPVQYISVSQGNGCWLSTSQEIPLDVVYAPFLDFSLVLRGAWPTGGD